MFWGLLPAIILNAMIGQLGGIGDKTVVGHILDSNCLAAIGVAVPTASLFYLFANTIINGSIINAGKQLGKCDTKGINQVFSSSAILMAIVGFAAFICYFCFSLPIAGLLCADENLAKLTSQYIRGMAFAYPGIAFHCLLNTFAIFENQKLYHL